MTFGWPSRPVFKPCIMSYNIYLFIITSAQLRSQCDVWLALKASLQTVQHALHAASESGRYFWFVSSSHPIPHTTHSFKQSPMLGPVSNQHRMTAIKQQVVLIIYSNPTPLALALCVSDVVLGIALNTLNWGSSQAHCGDGFLLCKRYVSTDVCWGHQQPTVISTVGVRDQALQPTGKPNPQWLPMGLQPPYVPVPFLNPPPVHWW